MSQQFVTDDAAIVEYRAFQLEAWHGGEASWIMPACSFVPDLEFTAALGFVTDDDGRRALEYGLGAKYLFRSVEEFPFGFGIAAGVGLNPHAQTTGDRVESIFAFVPLSLALFDDRLILHQNTGWAYRLGDHHHHGPGHEHAREHVLTWGFRFDMQFAERFALIAELFGENRLMPEYQVGLRSDVVTDRLAVDVSYGGHIQRGLRGFGPVIGIAWTPRPFR